MRGYEDYEIAWDQLNAVQHSTKHPGVYFEDAARVFLDQNRIERYDQEHQGFWDDRYQTIGIVDDDSYFVVYTLRDDTIWLISARFAEAKEQNLYNWRIQDGNSTYDTEGWYETES